MSDKKYLVSEETFKNLDFGDHCLVEQKRYGADNEFFVYKVIQRVKSNGYVNVPIDSANTGIKEVIHPESVECLRVVCCGPCEDTVYKVAVKDISPQPTKALSEMTEEDAKILCERMGWEFHSFKIPDKRTTIVMRIKWNGKNHFFILTETGHLSFHEIETRKNYPINPFTLVDTLRSLGYGVERKGAGE